MDSRASRLAALWYSAKAPRGVFQHALDQADQLVFLEGLLDEIHGALLHRVHRHRHIAVAGDEHHGQRRLALEQAVLQFQPGHAAHADVDDQAGDFARVVAREEGFGGVEAANAVVLAFEQPLQRIAHGLVVVDDIDGALLRNQAHTGHPGVLASYVICSAGAGHWNPEGETATGYFGAIVDVLGLHPALVRLDDGPAQIQADAHAFDLGGEERFVQALHHFGRQARARVEHREFHDRQFVHLLGHHPQFDAAARRRPPRVLDRFGGVLQAGSPAPARSGSGRPSAWAGARPRSATGARCAGAVRSRPAPPLRSPSA